MLTGLQLTNFKSWDDTGPIRLASLTVFFGRNSSGKSSLLQSMLLMKQTAESLDPRQILDFGGPEKYVDLGSYQEVVMDHDTSRNIGLTFEWQPLEAFILRPSTASQVVADDLIFSVSIGQERKEQQLSEIFVRRMSYQISADPIRNAIMLRRPNKRYDLTTRGLGIRRRSTEKDNLPAPIKCYGFPDEAVSSFLSARVLADLSHQFDELMSAISYVGPLRERPRRGYQWRGTSPAFVGPLGENTVGAILAARREDRTVGDRGFEANLGYWLKHLGMIDRFTVEQVSATAEQYELKVTVAGSNTQVSITDVGFGVSQVLPVLVQVFYAPTGSSVILEQPEIHLHPAAQSALGDVLLAAVKDNSVQLLVETHSEHLLHRIQRRIAEEQISKNDVAMYFIESRDGKSEINELKVDEYGNITNWPQDFFGDEMGDLSAMTEAAAERRLRRG